MISLGYGSVVFGEPQKPNFHNLKKSLTPKTKLPQPKEIINDVFRLWKFGFGGK